MSLLDYPFDSDLILQKKKKLKKELLLKEGLIEKRIAILSGSTIGEIQNILELFLLNYGIKPVFYQGQYARYYEDLMFDDGSLKEFNPDFIYIHTTSKNLENLPVPTDSSEDVDAKLAREFAKFKACYQKALSFGSIVIVNNFEKPFYRMYGNKDAVVPQGVVNYTTRLNLMIADFAAATENFYVNDIDYLSTLAGLDNWFNLESWYLYKYAVSVDRIPELTFSIAKIIKSVLGKNKKSVICDLDNTLWGGVIGDDGVEGITIGNEQPAGMSYTEFQAYLKKLTGLGIMLNVCSKNEEAIAKKGFTDRKEAPLNVEDFICFKANWEPKHQNIANIAKEINIGEDSFVFIDDNPVERDIVRNSLAVTVPEVTCPEDYIKSIDRAGFFEITTFTKDDAKRNEMYKQNAMRAQAEASFGDYKDYLLSLDMTSEIGAFSSAHSERITQLINKTNQFNFTTRRYTQGEVDEIIANTTDYISAYAKLVDKFGDNGITTCFIASVEDKTATIDLWVMSCRVFKRHFEFALFDYFVSQCVKRGITTVKASYLPTAKNVIIKDFYDELGFELVKEEDGAKYYTYTIPADYTNKNEVIKMEEV
ncbi:MAG: HAD-IIIC family phosphatase [Oscillospiraceae bacterium]|nr:HAD-IIIC family phosphatase [Oscillospiraceae bacterium]